MADDTVGVFAIEQVVEAQPIQGLPVSVTGMVVRSLRGPVNKPILIRNISKYRRMFGRQDPNSYSYESVEGFFDTLGRGDDVASAGGADLWVSRVLGSGGGSNVKAALTLNANIGPATFGSTTSTAFPAIVDHGFTFQPAVNGVAQALITISAVAANLTGTGATYAAVVASNKLRLEVNGIPRTVTFAGTENTQALFLAAINAQVPGLHTNNNAGEVDLFTDQKGSGATLEVLNTSDADVLASLGLSAALDTGTGNVADANIVGMTAAEFAALLTASAGSVSTITTPTATSVTWTTNTAGAAPNGVQFTSGTGVTAAGFDLLLHAGVAAASPVPTVTLTAIGEGDEDNNLYVVATKEDTYIGGLATTVPAGAGVSQFTLTVSAASRIAVGDTLLFADATTSVSVRGYVLTIANQLITIETAVTIGAGGLTNTNTRITIEKFTITLFYEGNQIRQERGLCMSARSLQNHFATRINNGIDEQHVVASDNVPALTGGDNRPINVVVTGDALTGGALAATYNDVDYIGSSSTPKTGLYAFDQRSEIRRIAIPGITGITQGAVSRALIDYAEGRTDCRAVCDSPAGMTDEGLVATYKLDKLGVASYGSVYFPWIQVLDKVTGQNKYFPPSGWVLGANARTNARRGISKAPGGLSDGIISGANGVEVLIDTDMQKTLVGANVNVIKFINGAVRIMLARTLTPGPDKLGIEQIHARDTYIYLRESIKAGTQFVYLEPNTKATRTRYKSEIEAFLETEWRKGTLDGDTKSQAFKVVCDESNNPPDQIIAKVARADVFVHIPRVVEKVLTYIGPLTSDTAPSA